MCFPVGFVLAACLAVPSFARWQEPPPQESPSSQDELDRKLEELKRANEEFNRTAAATSRKLEATLAELGGGPPWPSHEPEFTTPEAWREAVLAAPRVDRAQVLAELRDVRLDVALTVQVPDVCPRYDVYLEIVEAVHATGRRTERDSGAILRVDLQLVSTDFDFTQAGHGRVPFHLFRCNAGLVLPARVLRADGPRHTRLTIGSVEELWIAPGPLTREMLVGAIDRTIGGVLSGASDVQYPEPKALAWTNWLGDAEQTVRREGQFRASRRAEDDLQREPGAKLDPDLAAIGAFGAVGGAFQTTTRTRDVDAVEALAPARRWIDVLGAHGLALDALDAPRIAHDARIEATESILGAPIAHVGRWRITVGELDALAVLGDRYVRIGGTTFEDVEFFLGLPTAMERFASDAATKLERRALEALGRAGPPPLPQHPNADAVDAFLATRQRLEVPTAERRAIANRIAHGLANAAGIPDSVKREWLMDVNGTRMLYLPYVGGARQGSGVPRGVRDAVDRAIDDLVRADPLGFYAFDQPWNHDGDRRVVLPAEYAEYFARSRPAGPGALCSVRVVSASEFAWQRLGTLDFAERAPLAAEVDGLREPLKDARVLLCEYIAADGNMNLVHPRGFWYRTAPANWTTLSAKLSSDNPLRHIGPAHRMAPDYLADADRALDGR